MKLKPLKIPKIKIDKGVGQFFTTGTSDALDRSNREIKEALDRSNREIKENFDRTQREAEETLKRIERETKENFDRTQREAEDIINKMKDIPKLITIQYMIRLANGFYQDENADYWEQSVAGLNRYTPEMEPLPNGYYQNSEDGLYWIKDDMGFREYKE